MYCWVDLPSLPRSRSDRHAAGSERLSEIIKRFELILVGKWRKLTVQRADQADGVLAGLGLRFHAYGELRRFLDHIIHLAGILQQVLPHDGCLLDRAKLGGYENRLGKHRRSKGQHSGSQNSE